MGAFLEDLKRLPPGFRFKPTDEQLVCDYLLKKSSSSRSKAKYEYLDIITDIDFYNHEPAELPGICGLNIGRDEEWFFFTRSSSKKYPNGSRLNRATKGGYWKTTGRDREIPSKGKVVGMKKTLGFHKGRAPRGERTDWTMYEYRLVNHGDVTLEKDSFVLCRLFLKETKTKQHAEDSNQGENSTSTCYAPPPETQHEDVVNLPAKEDETKERDISFDPLNSSLNENCTPVDDYLQQFLLECLKNPEKETGADLLSAGGIQPGLFIGHSVDPEDIFALTSEGHGQTVDQQFHAENTPQTVDFVHGDTSGRWDFDRIFSPDVSAGDFLELNDLTFPLECDYSLF